MFDIEYIKNEIKELKKDVPNNYDKLLSIYLRLVIEYIHVQKTDEDL